MCEIFSVFQDEEGSLVLATHSKVREKCFNWGYGSTCNPEVEVNTHMKGVSFGLLQGDFQKLWVISAVYENIINR